MLFLLSFLLAGFEVGCSPFLVSYEHVIIFNSKEGKETRDEEGNPVRIFTLRPASGHQEFFDLMRKHAREAKAKVDFFHDMPEVFFQ